MIYFDNAATSIPKPLSVKQAVCDALDNCGNPARGAHEKSLNGLRKLDSTRELIAKYFNVPDSNNVAFTPNATTALNIAIASIKGHIVTTAAEHNSVLRPVYKNGNYTIVPVDTLGRLDINNLEKAVRPDTEAVVMTHASNLTGNVFDIALVGNLCKAKNIKFIVDASQTAGLINIDMASANISALCFSGHKSLLGPQGTGAICLSPAFLPEPLIVGGSGSHSFSTSQPATMPDLLEAGTPNAHGLAGLFAGITYVIENNGNCFSNVDNLARRFIAQARDLGYTLYGDLDAIVRTPVVSLNLPGFDSADLADILHYSYDICVRAGAHCAPLMHKAQGSEHKGAVRFSFSHFNTKQEIDFAIDALRTIQKERAICQ